MIRLSSPSRRSGGGLAGFWSPFKRPSSHDFDHLAAESASRKPHRGVSRSRDLPARRSISGHKPDRTLGPPGGARSFGSPGADDQVPSRTTVGSGPVPESRIRSTENAMTEERHAPADPKAVLAEHGVTVLDGLDVMVVENGDDCVHMLPGKPLRPRASRTRSSVKRPGGRPVPPRWFTVASSSAIDLGPRRSRSRIAGRI